MAVALTVALFLVWLVVGWATVELLHTRRNALRNLLMAPTVGFAVFTLPIVTINRLGLPIISFSWPLTIVLTVAALAVLWWKRPFGSLRNYGPVLWRAVPYLGVLVLGFVLTARPMMEYQFDWLSYANDDMANYVGDATRFAMFGALDYPNIPSIAQGTDYMQVYWAFTFAGLRIGTAPTLSWVMGLTGLPGHEIFMPATVAFHFALLLGISALILQGRKSRLAALVTAVVLSLSALTSLGVLYQLNAQVAGLALLCVAGIVLLRPLVWATQSLTIRHGILTGIVGAAIMIDYPEVLPFLALAFLVAHGVGIARRRWAFSIKPFAISLGVAAVVAVVSLNSYAPSAINYLVGQVAFAGGGDVNRDTFELFPYFRLPSGVANLWGLQPIALLPEEPMLSTTIGVGAVLLLLSFLAALVLSWRPHPVAVITLAMLLVAAQLFRGGAGFGLFKLAMFIQPFILGTLVVAWFGLFRGRGVFITLVRVVPILAVGLLGVPVQQHYVIISRGVGTTLIELRDPSSTRVNQEFRELLREVRTDPAARLMLDTSSLVLSKFQSVYSQGIATNFPSKYPYTGFELSPPSPLANAESRAVMQEFADTVRTKQTDAVVPWFPDSELPRVANLVTRGDARLFRVNRIGAGGIIGQDCTHMIAASKQQNLLNRWNSVPSRFTNFFMLPCRDVRNHLVFVDSELGHSYYGSADTRVISMFQLEDDNLMPNSTVVGLGRRVLLQALHPTPGARLVLNVTTTYLSNGSNVLPPAVVIGEEAQSQPLPITGRGSARVFSPPLTPITIDGQQYYGLDMGVDGQPFAYKRDGLMQLFGTNIRLDRRLLVGFARDISLISEEQLAQLIAPQQVRNFPIDLANRELEYSGVFEDGYVSESAFFGLMQPDAPSSIVVRGTLPQVGDDEITNELVLLVDGEEVARRQLTVGAFELGAFMPAAPGRRRVELQFMKVQTLPGTDQRPVSARLQFVGFEVAQTGTTPATGAGAAASAQATPTGESATGQPAPAEDISVRRQGIAVGANWGPSEKTDQGEPFRWVDNDAEVILPPSNGAARSVSVDIEPGPGVGSKPFQLEVLDQRGRNIRSVQVPGRQLIDVPVPADVQALRFHVDSPRFALEGDPRILNFRVFKIGWTGSAALVNVTSLRLSNAPTDIGPAADRRALGTGTLPPDGLFVGNNWFPYETFEGANFRWVDNDAEIVVSAPTGNKQRVRLSVEPGPGVGRQPFTLRILDAQGQVVASANVASKLPFDVTLPVVAGDNQIYRLHADGGGQPTPNDPRTLNFRVFSFAWAE